MRVAMKKFYSLLLAAVALFGFAACTQDNNDVNVGEKTTMTVYAAFENDDTRMALADNGVTPTWEVGDQIYINDVAFTATANGDKVAFTTTSETLPSGAYTAVYRGAESTNAICALQQAVVNSFSKQTPVVAAGEAIEEGSTLSFKNVASLLQFKALEDGDYTFKAVGGENFAAAFTINADATVAFAAEGSSEVTLEGCKVGNTYVVAVAPVTLSEGLEVVVGEKVVKSGGVGMVLERNVIYPLGDLGSVANFEGFEWGLVGAHQGWSVDNVTPMLETETENLYIAENVTLVAPGFKFAKHGLESWETAGENTTFGAYTLSEGLEYYDFTSEIGSGWYDVYDNNLGEHANNIGVADFTKNYDVYIYVAETADWGHKLQYTIVEHGTEITMPGVEPEPEPSVPGLESTWALSGAFNNWSDDNVMLTTEVSNLFVVKGVALAANAEVKVKEVGTWDITFGGGNPVINADKWITVYNNGSNVKVLTEGVYDVYFELDGDTGKLYLMTEGTAIEAAQDGNNDEEPETPSDPETPGEPSEPGLASEWAILGVFNGWQDQLLYTTEYSNIVVAEGVTMEAAQGFLVRKPSTDWADKYGAGDVNYIQANRYINTVKEGVDMCLEAAGTYDIYFNISTKAIYVMEAGADYATAELQTVSGKEPVQEEPEVTEVVVYLKPNSNWMQSDARFAAYFFGGTTGEKWVSMTAVGDGTYECHLPEGYELGCNIIFCRMNPSTATNNWNNKWNQTADLKTPTDGKNLYTVADGTWDKGGGAWSVK